MTPSLGSFFPQDRVLINRLDSLCTLMVTGQWPSGRRYVPEAQLNPSSELVGDEMAYTRAIRKPAGTASGPGEEGEDGEFTVKLLKVTQQWRMKPCYLRHTLLRNIYTN